MSETDVLTLATRAVAERMHGSSLTSPEVLARAALEAAGVLDRHAQPLPVPGGTEGVHDKLCAWLESSPVFRGQPETPAMIERIQARRDSGLVKYGTVLEVENGRDPAGDLLDELLDGMNYAHQGFERARRRSVASGATGMAPAVTWWGIRRNRIGHESLAILGVGDRLDIEIRG